MSLMQIDIVLPSQHFEPRRPQAPEQRLMIAVFQDALECLAGNHGDRLCDEAKRWFLADEADWPYSFQGICGVLDLDANAVRQRLRVAPERRPAFLSPRPEKAGSSGRTALRTQQ